MGITKSLNLMREHAEVYERSQEPRILEAERIWCLTLTGRGEPGGAVYQEAVDTLFGLARRLRRDAQRLGRDFKLMPLECTYWSARKGRALEEVPRGAWHWRLNIRMPSFVKAKDLALACAQLEDRRETAMARAVKIEWLALGRTVQALHVGPYDSEAATLERMRAAAAARGLALDGPHHEVYLSDPGKTSPERLRTLLRRPLQGARAAPRRSRAAGSGRPRRHGKRSNL
jgi:hypothetical protein